MCPEQVAVGGDNGDRRIGPHQLKSAGQIGNDQNPGKEPLDRRGQLAWCLHQIERGNNGSPTLITRTGAGPGTRLPVTGRPADALLLRDSQPSGSRSILSRYD